MHSIEHPNIVRLYGVVLHMDSLMLVRTIQCLVLSDECYGFCDSRLLDLSSRYFYEMDTQHFLQFSNLLVSSLRK